ncbi:MAG TPA: MaoC family dehydratase [Solimonas sp.]|nr:MaoC family dehydratase [Solimonas sp.]
MLQQMPSPLSLYTKAVTTRRPKPKGLPNLPPLEVEMAGLGIDAGLLARYRAICGFPEGGETLPLTFPQVLAAPLHMYLMTQPQFPLPIVGLVHLRNHIEQVRPLRADESLGVKVRLGEAREVKQGIEFDFTTEFSQGEAVVWSAVTTVLHRIAAPKTKSKAPPPPLPELAEYRAFDVPEDIGRRYAPISKDYNPIHLYAPTAKLLGFQRHIAHGMWSLARCLALLQAETPGREPQLLDVQFRQPLFVPAKVALKFQRREDAFEFALLARSSDKVHLTGLLR